MKINIKYFNEDMKDIELIDGKSDWFDLRCNEVYKVETEMKVVYPVQKESVARLERKDTKYKMPIEKGIFEGKEVEFVRYNKGDFMLIDLGIAMELPTNHEAYVVPRSSTFKTYGVIQTNGKGIIDESYRGEKDVWLMPVLAMKDGFFIIGERVCQFRVMKKMPKVEFNKVDKLSDESRGGHGGTGTK